MTTPRTAPGTGQPTLDEVARVAGVSRATASRAINGGQRVSARAQSAVDVGLGTAQNFSDKARPASTETYVLKPDAKAVGAVVNEEDAHTAPGVKEYLESRG